MSKFYQNGAKQVIERLPVQGGAQVMNHSVWKRAGIAAVLISFLPGPIFARGLSSDYLQPVWNPAHSFSHGGVMWQENETDNAADSSRARRKKRREWMSWHQMAGVATWILWLSTCISGEQAYTSLYQPRQEQAKLYGLLYASRNPSALLLAYAAYTADDHSSMPALAVLAMNPQENLLPYLYFTQETEWEVRKGEELHQGLARATLGMYALTGILAMTAPKIELHSHEGSGVDHVTIHKSLALVHLAALVALPILGSQIEKRGPEAAGQMRAVGWAGLGVLSAAFVVITF